MTGVAGTNKMKNETSPSAQPGHINNRETKHP